MEAQPIARDTCQQRRSPEIQFDEGSKTFFQFIQNLQPHLPHLIHVLQPTCRHPTSGNVDCFEFHNKRLSKHSQCLSLDTHQHEEIVECLRRLCRPKDNVDYRVLIVQDLSPILIGAIGQVFQTNPEFFEAHLHRSGYRSGSYDDEDARAWNTSLLDKDYFSLRWHRPILRKYCQPITSNDRDKLLEGEVICWTEESYSQMPSGRELRIQLQHEVMTTTNIFRQEWVLSTNPERINLLPDHQVPAVWEERATVFRCSLKEGSPLIILLDPLPKLSYRTTSRWPLKPFSFIPPREPETTSSLVLPYSPASLRGPPSKKIPGNLSPEQIRELGIYLNQGRSTKEDMMKWMYYDNDEPDSDPDPLFALVKVIHSDIVSLLHVMGMILEKIGLDSMDDNHIEERLSYWRTLVNRLQVEIPEVGESLTSFADFAHLPPKANSLIDDAAYRISRFLEQSEKTQAALRADLSVLESKRGIKEAESVAKLTELAFFFVPLTFASSLFSMQIKQLKEEVPVSTFITAAVITICFSYGIRLLVRSNIVLRYSKFSTRQARKFGKIKPTEELPTHVYITWLFNSVPTILGIPAYNWIPLSITLIGSAIGILFLWKHAEMDGRPKLLITSLVTITDVALVWVSTGRFIRRELRRANLLP